MSLSPEQIKNILEAALMAAGQPLSIDRLLSLFLDEQQPSRDQIREALKTLAEDCEKRGVELKEVNSGFRFQARQDYAPWISRLWEEKPPRYSRALLETLSLIAYRQPITRGEIEDVRGVSVSTNIIKTLLERDWVKVVGHRDVPGKPAMYATTKEFLDYFNLKNLSELPTLAEIRDIDTINAELDLVEPGSEGGQQGSEESGTEEGVAQEMTAEDVTENVSLADDGVMEEMSDPRMSGDGEIDSDLENMPPIEDGIDLKAVSVAD
jgi:segregation and condensation protein B